MLLESKSESMDLNIPKLIERKRDGEELSEEETNFLVKSIADKDIDATQLGAVLMAIYLKGMSRAETVNLTRAMVKHGESLSWPEAWRHLVVDKHSTGGVGDKVSLPLAPVLAALGLKVPMISGRGLGFTGGTLDKLESIEGFNVRFSSKQILDAIENIGCCIVGQTEKIVPVDKVMYATRDVTATISSIPLIVSSIISKKAAEGLIALVLDVKCGQGSFMKNEKDARELAQWLADTANGLGIKTTAVLTKMDNPIGMTIGNSVEVIESIECLQGKGPKDLEELVCIQGGHLLVTIGKASNPEEGYKMIENSLKDGSGLKKFEEMLKVQNVSSELAKKLCDPRSDLYQLLPIAVNKTELPAAHSGLVSSIKALALANLATELGAGRFKPTDQVDHGVGFVLKVRVGSYVKSGENWAILYHSKPLTDNQKAILKDAVVIDSGDECGKPLESRIIDVIMPNEK